MFPSRDRTDDSKSCDSIMKATADRRTPLPAILDRQSISIPRLLLRPLKRGVPVALRIEDKRLPKRKRVEHPLLLITPMAIYGRPSSQMAISVQTHGCEIVDTRDRIAPIVFMRMGLSAALSTAMATELTSLFLGDRK